MTNTRNLMHEKIEDVEQFVRLNGMKINEGKTKILFFNNKKTDGVLHYNCNGQYLIQVEEMKVLGFWLQSDMRVNLQVEYMVTKSNGRIWGLRKLMANGGSIEDGKQYYITWVQYLFEFAVPVWNGRLTVQETETFEKIQKKCLKIILGRGYQN